MSFRLSCKDAFLASTFALVWIPLGCGESPGPATPAPATTPAPAPDPEASASPAKGKKFADDDMGIAEKREARRKAAAAGGNP